MKKNRTFMVLVACIVIAGSLYGQSDFNQLIVDFTSSDWKVVKVAKLNLEGSETKAISDIINLLKRDEHVKLTNTGSLIYPGAEKIYGYGQIIEYSIDNISIRAGWLLEDITFNNFGFSGVHLQDEGLIPFIKVTFPQYYNNASNRKSLETSTPAELSRLIHKLSIKNASDWWEKEGADWTRLGGLVEALKSFDEKRQVKALFYMRNGETKCSDLTKEYYFSKMAGEIVRLSASQTKRVSEHAQNILTDTRLMWLENKD